MTHYASVLRLDRRAVRDLRITDLYSLHRVVYSLYEDVRSDVHKSEHQLSGLQFAEQGGDSGGKTLLLLSDRPPADCVDLNTRGDQAYPVSIQTKCIPSSFLLQSHYRFKVIMNPVKKDNATKKRLPIKGRDAIAQWFMRSSEKNWGFSVQAQSLQIDKVEVKQFRDKKQHQVTLAQASLSGFLTVTDQEKFAAAFKKGIGRARTFGCGLLQIVPV